MNRSGEKKNGNSEGKTNVKGEPSLGRITGVVGERLRVTYLGTH